MFLHLSVILFMGEYLGPGTPPRQVPLPPGPGTPPRTRYPPDQVPPLWAVHAGRYDQQVGGMHPTGMHSFLITCTFGGGSGGWSMV